MGYARANPINGKVMPAENREFLCNPSCNIDAPAVKLKAVVNRHD